MLTVVTDGDARAEMRVGLDEIVREGARRMLAAALEAEATAYVEALTDERDDDGHRLVTRNSSPDGCKMVARKLRSARHGGMMRTKAQVTSIERAWRNGRRAGFRSRWARALGGSTPPARTAAELEFHRQAGETQPRGALLAPFNPEKCG